MIRELISLLSQFQDPTQKKYQFRIARGYRSWSLKLKLWSQRRLKEKLVSELELQIDYVSESSRLSENKMPDLSLKISSLETTSRVTEESRANRWFTEGR